MKTIPINQNWSFYAEDFEEGKHFTTDIPSSAQYALYRLGVKPDFNFGLNEGEYYELENKAWVFTNTFQIDSIGFSIERLTFHGVDTFASVYLNDTFLGRTENMFLKYSYDVKGILKQGENTLTVKFEKILDRLDRSVESEQHAPLNFSMDKRRPYARKMQCSWGWDWGPRILETGIWKSVELEFFDAGYIEDTAVRLESAANKQIRILGKAHRCKSPVQIKAEIAHGVQKVGEDIWELSADEFDRVVQLDELLLWYPNGCGAQNLYTVTLTLLSGETVEQVVQIETGFREIKLIEEPDGEGKSFLFEVNGIRLFAKGANWIPADAFINRVTEEDYRAYIDKAVSMNMNMLRIWGGGIYESEYFYRECNRRGILVWQDFMFTCAEYPDHQDRFVELVSREAEQAVKQLRNNPCMALYCGNNENNWLMQLYYKKNDDYFFGGNRLYKNVLKDVCRRLDDTVPYWVSSPYSETGDCNDPLSGDIHAWDVYCFWAETGCYEQVNGKFISEFGFQGSASKKTVYAYTPEAEHSIYSDVSFAHNKCYEGIEHCVKYLYTEVGGFNDFESYIHLLQFIQGEAVKLGVEHWRSRKFKTAGTLFWQMNDNWDCTSFSCIDHQKRNKALYYYAKRFYDDLLVTMKNVETQASIIITNDRLCDVSGSLSIKAYRTDGTLLNTVTIPVLIGANSSETVFNGSVFELAAEQGLVSYPQYHHGTVHVNKLDKIVEEVVFFTELTVGSSHYRNYKALTKYRRVHLQDPAISCRVLKNQVILTASKPAFGVYAEADTDVQFHDNFITMEPGREYVLTADGSFNTVRITHVYAMTDHAV